MIIFELKEVSSDGYDEFSLGFYLNESRANEVCKEHEAEAKSICKELKMKSPVYVYKLIPHVVDEAEGE